MTYPTQGDGGGGGGVSSHSSTHEDGGSDEIDAGDLSGGKGTANQILITDGSALSYALVDTANLAAQAVTSTEIDGSGGTASQFLQTDGTAAGTTWATPSASDISDVSADSVTDAHHTRYTNEEAQDAVGTNYDSTLAYDDATPSFGIANGGVDTTQLASQAVTTTEIDGSGGTANQFIQTDGTAAGTTWATPSASDISDVSADSVTDAHHAKYTNEEAQDAVGTNYDATMSYDDTTPTFGIANGGVNTAQLASQAVTATEIDGSGGTAGQVLDTDGTAAGVAWSNVDTDNMAAQAVTTTEIDGSGGTASQFLQTDGTASGATWATPSASDISDVSADSVTDAHHAKYTNEEAQDAVGLNYDATLAYDDATPSFGIANGGVDTTQLASQAVTPTEVDGSGGTAGQVLDTDGTAGGVAWSNVDTDNIATDAVGQDELSGNAHFRQANIPMTEIANGNQAVGLQKQVPSGKTLKIWEVGVQDDSESAPAGLTIEVRDLTNAVDIVSQNTKHSEGSPIASKSGAIDVQFRIDNGTGGTVNASGYIHYTME